MTVRHSAAILIILGVSVLSGFLYNIIWDHVDRKRYPQEYSEFVSEYASVYGVPEYIVYAVIKTESDFSSNAVSSAGAVASRRCAAAVNSLWSLILLRPVLRNVGTRRALSSVSAVLSSVCVI